MVTFSLLNRTQKGTPPAQQVSDGKVKDVRLEALKRFAVSITVFNIVGRL